MNRKNLMLFLLLVMLLIVLVSCDVISGTKIKGVVVDAFTRQPIAGAVVEAEYFFYENRKPKTIRTKTDNSGQFTFKVSSSRSIQGYGIEAFKYGYSHYGTFSEKPPYRGETKYLLHPVTLRKKIVE